MPTLMSDAGCALIVLVDFSHVYNQRAFVSGGHWLALDAGTSSVRESPYFRNLSSQIVLKALCNFCMFGHFTNGPTTSVGIFTSIRRMRWSCDQNQFRHVHTGKRNKFANPTFFIDVVAFVTHEIFSVKHCPKTPVILPK